MSLFDLFGKKNETSISEEVVQIVQGIGSAVTPNLKTEGQYTLCQIIEAYKEDLGIAGADVSSYTFTSRGKVLSPTESLNSLIQQGLLKGGDTIVASTRSDSKA